MTAPLKKTPLAKTKESAPASTAPTATTPSTDASPQSTAPASSPATPEPPAPPVTPLYKAPHQVWTFPDAQPITQEVPVATQTDGLPDRPTDLPDDVVIIWPGDPIVVKGARGADGTMRTSTRVLEAFVPQNSKNWSYRLMFPKGSPIYNPAVKVEQVEPTPVEPITFSVDTSTGKPALSGGPVQE
jgi:hypothetical protein